ncbi:HET-domain-containing protein [Polyplosphaeria fusca]|uniref:HET-domain-containing protein n=1 Tax=Polyplosphaeria fusca TaxID=682080 RepID=A0A9P4UX84_9PLEO|nr:HET-domain-containing protein [Polyplosphaeria fusca]
MRLLHFDSSKRLVLTDFRGKTIPPYAILSHRWGKSEILFEDIATASYKEKDGYRKIEFCAERAAQDHLQYFWIDTCCIDKWNLAELSKSINSMFRWYRDAKRCYVFLSDVSVAKDASQSEWEPCLRASKWFTRGWTLQELIAPVSVEFFSKDGWRIGDKTSLEPLVHEITSIPLKALQNCPLDQFTTAERIKWAQNRQTTEEEDAAYCLLGILDVVIPAAYGEGVEKAWKRLQIELEAVSSSPCSIPFSQNEQFVGWESQVFEIERKLFERTQATIIAIIGAPGTGKSQLALEVAHRTRQKYRTWSVFWIDAGDTDSLYRSYASIAQKLHIPGWDDEKVDSRLLVKTHLSGKSQGKYLLVFDNTDDVSLGSSGMSTGAANLSDYLPQSDRCSILYTTTNSDIATRPASDNVVELKEMAPDTAQKMLENYLSISLSISEQHEAQLLLQELSYLPLAIVQAAAYIKTRNITIQAYRSQVDRQRESVLRCGSTLPEDSLEERDTTGPVATTLLISLERIRDEEALAADYLFLAACVDRKDIPLDLLPSSSHRERDDAIKFLGRYGLLTRRPAESSLDLHQLVHCAVRGWLRKQERLDEWTGNAIKQLNRVFPGGDDDGRSKWRRLLPHARYVLSHSLAEQKGGDRSSLTWNTATALYNDGRWKEAEELVLQAMKMSKTKLGADHPNTLASMANLASTYRNQGRMNNLAFTFKCLGKVKQAFSLMQDCCRLQEEVLGSHHPHTVSSQAALAAWQSEAIDISE